MMPLNYHTELGLPVFYRQLVYDRLTFGRSVSHSILQQTRAIYAVNCKFYWHRGHAQINPLRPVPIAVHCFSPPTNFDRQRDQNGLANF